MVKGQSSRYIAPESTPEVEEVNFGKLTGGPRVNSGKRLLVISPEARLTAAIRRLLSLVEGRGQALLLQQYPLPGQLRRILHARQPTLVMIGLREPGRALQLIEELHIDHPKIVVAAAHTVNEPDLILAAVRAGAAEYLGPPFEVGHLEQALARQPVNEGNTKPRGRLISFLPACGGCGASTAAMHLAAAVSRETGKRVLLVDFDFHLGILGFRLGLSPEYNFLDALRRSDCLDELWSQLTSRWKGLDVLTSPPRSFSSQTEDLGPVSAVFASARRTYEWVISDLPAAVFSSCREPLETADAVYLVCTPELFSLHLARRKVQELLDLGVPPAAVQLLLNRAGGRRSLSPAEVGKLVGIPVAYALRNDYDTVNNAFRKRSLAPEDSQLGRQFRDLARRLTGAPAKVQSDRAFSWKDLFFRNGGKVLPSPGQSEDPGHKMSRSWLQYLSSSVS